ncbi:hypothetical protein [Catenuloplanes atrovinosus]|uniref:LigA protein n=1 Tax=Catenuloplanes atrovinosus TaxID=137266 RepID=A0AAE4CAI9_9ACTN|nr:hypothetical protein [Catenuloplanes atrovinosus]MDR7277032.1 hypothetical protein [Catenuloplanes atrovinosus]
MIDAPETQFPAEEEYDPDEPADLLGLDGPVTATNYGQTATYTRSMNQYINQYYGQIRAAQQLNAGDITLTLEGYVDRVFFRPANPKLAMDTDRAATVVEEHRSVLLVGERGTGVHTAAVALLSRLGRPVHDVPIDDDKQCLLPIDQVGWPSQSAAAYILTVPDGAVSRSVSALESEIATYQRVLITRGDYLVVIIDPRVQQLLGGVHGVNALAVGPPEPRAVLLKELAGQEHRLDVDALAHHQALAETLTDLPPRQVRRLALRIVAAADIVLAQNVNDPVTAIAEQAVQAYRNWNDELEGWFAKVEDARARLFLIALAFLEGEPGSLVLRQAEALGRELKEPPDAYGGIASAGIRQLAATVNARLDERHRVMFDRPAYAASVLGFVHADRSDEFRKHLWFWAVRLPMRRGSVPSVPIAERIADAMFTMAMSVPEPDAPEIYWVIQRWQHVTLRPVVAGLVTAIALSPEAGPRTRRRLNRWASESTDTGVLGMIAIVCAGELADSYPRAAFTRLNNLAARGFDSVESEVVAGVLRLWERPRHRLDVLHRVTDWITAEEPRRSVGLRCLAGLTADPPGARRLLRFLLEQPEQTRTELVAGLSQVFALLPAVPEEIWPAMASWLSAAAEDSSLAPVVGELMFQAVGVNPGASVRASRLVGFVVQWQPMGGDVDPRRRAVRDLMIERICHADPFARGARSPEPVVLR